MRCVICKKDLPDGSHWIDGKGPYCNAHAFQIQAAFHVGGKP